MISDQSSMSSSASSTNGTPRREFRTSLQQYESEFTNICSLVDNKKLHVLRRVSVEGNLKSSKFRSIYWAIFLDVLRDTSDTWKEQKAEQRFAYESLKQRFSLNPHINTATKDDPLSQDELSVWNQHFCDQELLAVIQQDVVRTFPGVEFFRKDAIQEMMLNILFTYARKYTSMVYRQGMHEVLAPIIFVVHSDQQALVHVKDLVPTVNELIVYLLNPDYIEADCFEIFSKVMDGIECYYKINDLIPSSSGHFPTGPLSQNTSEKSSPKSPTESVKVSELEVIQQLNTIKDQILAKEDPKLHEHLLKLEIPLSLFGIRWLRLLFGREFTLHDLLVVWDAIFAEDDKFDLINYLTVAMLICIRDKLINSDYTTTLTHLMKFPANADVGLIIRHALHFCKPHVYDRPPGVFVKSTKKDKPAPGKPTRVASVPGKSNSSTLPRSSRRQSAPQHRRVPSAHVNSINRINGIQNSAAIAALTVAAQSHNLDTDSEIVDGYLENDPEVIKLELQHAYNLMSVTRTKLLQYLAVLRRNLSDSHADEVHQSIEGIEELCSLLKPKNPYVFSMESVESGIEPATEANEISPRLTPNSTSTTPNRLKTRAANHVANDLTPSAVNPKLLQLSRMKEVEMRVFNRMENVAEFDFTKLPSIDPALERRNSQ
ncbi:TBC1 domain family member 5 [Culicoides brevitarsis]|uniref:TBC1 domain family member 5 n=1 Tax=Culicoides brevitarsis TaxID=469753 RepID=UPI00307C3C1E